MPTATGAGQATEGARRVAPSCLKGLNHQEGDAQSWEPKGGDFVQGTSGEGAGRTEMTDRGQ